MTTPVHAPSQMQPAHFLQAQPTVRFSFLNGCDDLHHLVIFDYATWSRSEGDEEDHELFSLDRTDDNVRSYNDQFPLSPNNLYLVRAYLDRGEIEMFFSLTNPGNPRLDLQILEYPEGPAFVTDDTFKGLTSDDKDLLVIDGMHI